MRTNLSTMIVSFAAFGFATFANAEQSKAWFNNHLDSWLMVSPAQLYQVDGNKVDASYKYTSMESTVKQTAKTTKDGTASDLTVTGIYSVPSIPLRAGLSADLNMGQAKVKDVADADLQNTKLTPQAVYHWNNMVSVGAAWDINFQSEKTTSKLSDDTDEYSENYSIFRPGVMYTSNAMEAGLTYWTKVDEKFEHKDQDGNKEKQDYKEAAKYIAHGRYVISPVVAAGGIIEYVQQADVAEKDQTTDKKVNNNQTIYHVNSEFAALPSLKMESDLAYSPAYYAKKEYMNSSNISSTAIAVASDYSVTPQASTGVGLGYDFGSDKFETTKYANNNIQFTVRGKMAF